MSSWTSLKLLSVSAKCVFRTYLASKIFKALLTIFSPENDLSIKFIFFLIEDASHLHYKEQLASSVGKTFILRPV
jgi:hypothetical protein